ncbi:hypothetical protein CAPTEDRAFT_201855 [Capitella teleta]|uniref:Uncharacterized protein n=1 Tax=Capitella teleta TaxID=283909 RepID=R7UIF2_CAPTE|nr:hypothetical protein CAPTEDRAFT_201855 [Capitella teleta]|eukprot:ELU03032.1 hypothetical protein CAPTEDRAFT_201855 [Capitella teleta]
MSPRACLYKYKYGYGYGYKYGYGFGYVYWHGFGYGCKYEYGYRFHCNCSSGNITRLGCGGSNTNKTVCNSLLDLMIVSAQLGFNSWGFNNSMHRYLLKKINSSSTSLNEVGHCSRRSSIFFEVHRLTRFHKRRPFDMTHVIG